MRQNLMQRVGIGLVAGGLALSYNLAAPRAAYGHGEEMIDAGLTIQNIKSSKGLTQEEKARATLVTLNQASKATIKELEDDEEKAKAEAARAAARDAQVQTERDAEAARRVARQREVTLRRMLASREARQPEGDLYFTCTAWIDGYGGQAKDTMIKIPEEVIDYGKETTSTNTQIVFFANVKGKKGQLVKCKLYLDDSETPIYERDNEYVTDNDFWTNMQITPEYMKNHPATRYTVRWSSNGNTKPDGESSVRVGEKTEVASR